MGEGVKLGGGGFGGGGGEGGRVRRMVIKASMSCMVSVFKVVKTLKRLT